MQKAKNRNASLDLLKCISMFMVVMLHETNENMGLKDVVFNPPADITYLSVWLIRTFSFVAVNCFILITGYFMCTSEFNYKKIIKLWITVETFSLVIYVFLSIIPYTEVRFSLKNALVYLLPVSFRTNWFVTSYFFVLFFSPFINKLLKAMSKREHFGFVLILTLVFSVIPAFIGDNFDTHNGYSAVWFIVLYITAAYIRLYGLPELHYGLIYAILSLMTFASVILSGIITSGPVSLLISHWLNYNSFTVFFASISLFMFFKNRNISSEKKVSKVIIRISSLSFGVALLHEHEQIQNVLWHKLIRLCDHQENILLFFGVMLLSAAAIYAAGIFAEWVRVSLYNKIDPYIMKTTDKIKDKLAVPYSKITARITDTT